MDSLGFVAPLPLYNPPLAPLVDATALIVPNTLADDVAAATADALSAAFDRGLL
jgi:hypothetical protein